MSWLKNLINRVRKNAIDSQPKVLHGKRKSRFSSPRKVPYKAECKLMFNGHETKVFDSTIKAYSRKQAVSMLEKGYSVEVTKIQRIREK